MEDLKQEKEKFKDIIPLIPYIIVLTIVIGILAFFMYKYANKKDMKIYEVIPGEIINENREEGFIFRTEEVVNTEKEGYVTYYSYDLSRVKKGSLVCSILDTQNKVDTKIQFLDKDYKNIKNTLSKYANNFSNNKFSDCYTNNIKLNQYLEEIKIIRSFDNQDKTYLSNGVNSFAPFAGIISYYVDGYEKISMVDFKDEFFKHDKIIETKTQNSNFVKQKDPLYKIVTDPEYQIIFKSDNDYEKELKRGTVNIKLPYTNDQTSAKISVFKANSGETYYKLSLDNFLEKCCENRIMDFSVVSKSAMGLKIPLRSIVYKNCYIIPKDFLMEDPLTREKYFLMKGSDKKILLTDINVCKEDDSYIYLDIVNEGPIKANDTLVSWDQRTYTVREMKKLPGVYNINKGYSVFRHVEILDQTSEYAIIKKGLTYSLASYDHIVLDQSLVDEGDLISN